MEAETEACGCHMCSTVPQSRDQALQKAQCCSLSKLAQGSWGAGQGVDTACTVTDHGQYLLLKVPSATLHKDRFLSGLLSGLEFWLLHQPNKGSCHENG